MQSTLKSFFTKPGRTTNDDKPTLVSKNTSNQPVIARPSKRKAETSQSYEATKRCRKFQSHWKLAFPWLRYDAETDIMWCDVCREYHSTTKGGPINRFVEGSNHFKVESVKDHDSSKFHKDCMATKAYKLNPSDAPLAKVKLKLNEDQRERYKMLFDTAFTIAKHNMSFRDFEVLCKLQLKHKVNIGNNYQNPRSCAEFIGSIAAVQREAATKTIGISRFIAVMADGSTDRSVAEQEAVFIRYVCGGTPVNRFIALVELDSGTADGVLRAVDEALSLVNIDIDSQRSKLVNINLDGASVNMGIYNGVAAK